MSRKIYLNADPEKANEDNIIQAEEIIGIEINKEISLCHDIFFADSLVIYADPLEKASTALRLNVDYGLSFQDTIASDQSNRPAYRRVVFYKQQYDTVYADYHAYGDIVCANDINNIYEEAEKAVETADKANSKVENHINDEAVHGATPDLENNKIVSRNDNGTFEVGKPIHENNPVRSLDLNNLDQAINQAIQNEASSREEADTDLEELIEAETLARKNADAQLDETLRNYIVQKIEEINGGILTKKDLEKPHLFIPTAIFNDADLTAGYLGTCVICNGSTYNWIDYPEADNARFRSFLQKYTTNYGANENANGGLSFKMPDFSTIKLFKPYTISKTLKAAFNGSIGMGNIGQLGINYSNGTMVMNTSTAANTDTIKPWFNNNSISFSENLSTNGAFSVVWVIRVA